MDDNDLVGVTEPADRDVAQAAAHRIADEQRPAEHRDRGRDAETTARLVRQ